MTIYQLTENSETGRSLAVFYDDATSTVVPGNHPRFEHILTALRERREEDAIKAMVDTARVIREYVSLSERVSLRGDKLYFDGDRIKGKLIKHIIRMVKAGDDVDPLIAFLEKLKQNPSEQSQDSLWRWLDEREFTVCPDGDFIAYKGVTRDGLSIHSGTAKVNGVQIEGQIPNAVGDVITMPRSKVNADTSNGCSHGLHAGTWNYASSFGAKILTVKINPRDVVSVPDCSDFQKLRVCRYLVIDIVDGPYETPVHASDYDDLDGCCDSTCDGCAACD